MTTVAFIGLGKMGSAMAARLLDTGHTVHVHNRTPSRSALLARRGAKVFATPRAACVGAAAVICMVADDEASQAIWCGPDGVLAGPLEPGILTIECSTLSYGWVMDLSARIISRGLRYIDAPVTGLPEAAAEGALTALVGAENADLIASRVLLEVLAERVIHFGPVGTGTAYKLIVNLLGAVQIASVAESMAIAERAGLNLEAVLTAIATGQAASPQVVRNSRRMAARDHHQNIVFTPALRLKDVRYGLQLANGLGIGSPFGALAQAVFQQLCDTDLKDANESAIFELARQKRP